MELFFSTEEGRIDILKMALKFRLDWDENVCVCVFFFFFHAFVRFLNVVATVYVLFNKQ